MAESDLQGALFTGAELFFTEESIAAANVAYPNIDFDPAGKPIWARVSYLPSSIAPLTAGALGMDQENGLLQIDISVPRNTGDSELRSKRDAARTFFITGRTFTQNSESARITSCDISPMRVVDNWVRVSFSIGYRAEFSRAAII